MVTAAITQTGDPLLKGNVLNSFLAKLDSDTLAGLTPSQALNHVIVDLSTVESQAINPVQPADIDWLKVQMEKSAPAADADAIDSFTNFLKTAPAGIVGVASYGELQSAASHILQTPALLDKWQDNKKYAASNADILKSIGEAYPINSETVIDAARDSLVLLQRPPDIGCAMSILTYKETDTAYGHLIANEYIAVQIVVRNLNRDQPFVVHDAEFQVNSDPTGRLSRFFSGRDKVIVRSLSAAQNSFDPRALIVHSAEGIGAILSATVPIFAVEELTNATAVFNGAFVPGLDKFWKDQTGDQLNLLNDTGFSSQTSSQTTVPQLASVLFVIFIPSKQFEEGWWTQPCVEKTYVGSTDDAGHLNLAGGNVNNQGAPQTANAKGDIPAVGTAGVLMTPDVQHALETCTANNKEIPPRHHGHWYTLGYRTEDKGVGSVPSTTNMPDRNADLFRNAYPKPFRKWPGNSLQLFAALSSTVVSGTHIIEESQLQPSISTLNCPTDAKSGNIQLPSPDTGTLSCPLTGKNLDKVAQLRLRNAKDATDVATAEGPVTVSGDSSKGMVAFPTAALYSLTQPAYNVFIVSSTGVEQKTALTLHFSTDPIISSISPNPIDLSKSPTPQNITINGYHLENVDSIELADQSNNKNKQTIYLTLDALKKDNQLLVPIDQSQFAVFGAKTTLEVTVTVNKKPAGSGVSVDFIGEAPKPPADKNIGTKPVKKAVGLHK